MEYKGKLYGKVHKSYFPLEATTEDWDALKNRITQLEAENQALRQPDVSKSVCCNFTVLHWESINKKFCLKCGNELK